LLKFPVNGLPADAKHYNGKYGMEFDFQLQHFMPKLYPRQNKDHIIPHSEKNALQCEMILCNIRKELKNLGVFTLEKSSPRSLLTGVLSLVPISTDLHTAHPIEMVIKGDQMRKMWVDKCNVLDEMLLRTSLGH